MELGLVEYRGKGYIVEYQNGQIVAANGPHDLGDRDWTEDELQDWYLDDDTATMLHIAGQNVTRLSIPYLPGVEEEDSNV